MTVISLDNARIRKRTGQPLTDPNGIVAPESLIRVGAHAHTATGLIVFIRDIKFVEGVRSAFYVVNGIQYCEAVASMTPTQPSHRQQEFPSHV